MAASDESTDLLPAAPRWRSFSAFAFAYFFSALLRGVTATLAPEFSAELGLSAGDLGLLAGAFFLGFALTQLPLGSALDRYGPRRVLIAFLLAAVLGCAAFALARSFVGLTLARALIGVGVSACLMAPMTTFRRRYSPVAQMRANSWMLMTGSLGMVASTLPVQWLLPVLGWRGLFWAVAGAIAVAILAIAWRVPRDERVVVPVGSSPGLGYLEIFFSCDVPALRAARLLPLRRHDRGAVALGRPLARQCVGAGARRGRPRALRHQRLDADRLHVVGRDRAAALCARLDRAAPGGVRRAARGRRTGADGAARVARERLELGALLRFEHVRCIAATGFGPGIPCEALAGRALSAYNLVIFAGVFVLQWGLGVAIDTLQAAGWDTVSAYRGSFALMALCCALSYLWFLWRDDGAAQTNSSPRTVDNPPPCPD